MKACGDMFLHDLTEQEQRIIIKYEIRKKLARRRNGRAILLGAWINDYTDYDKAIKAYTSPRRNNA